MGPRTGISRNCGALKKGVSSSFLGGEIFEPINPARRRNGELGKKKLY